MPDIYAASTSDWQRRPTFWNRPAVDTAEDIERLRADVAVIGAPWDGGSSYRPGARFGPRSIRSTAFNPSTHHLHSGIVLKQALRIVDFGDADCPVGQPSMSFAAIHEKVRVAVTAGAMPLVIGGDHSVAIPAIRAVAESLTDEAIGVIQLDAHVDTDVDIDGDPLSHGCVIRRIVEHGYVLGDNILQLGLRGFWPPLSQLDWASERHISWLTIEQAVQAPLLNAALDELGNRVSRVYLTIDLDALDPSFAPGVGTPEPGGFSTREVFTIIRAVCRRFEIIGADVVELVPAHDVADLSTNAALRIALEILAGVALRAQSTPK